MKVALCITIWLASAAAAYYSEESGLLYLNSVVPDRSVQYTPDWDSLDRRPLPDWYDEAKVGIFIHWGVFSVPSYMSEWFWKDWKADPSPNEGAKKLINRFMKTSYKPDFSYQDFAKDFTAEFFNATLWADIIENAGARYVVLTSKHHEGFTLWPSKYSYSWNSMDVGPHRDLVGELKEAISKKQHVRFGLYHSLYEWFHPLYLSDNSKNFTTQEFVNNKIFPEMIELVSRYEPELLWSDGEWEAPSSYWRSEEFLSWLYNESPVRDRIVVNDRWGRGTACHHGGYYTCQDRYNPGVLKKHKWENAMTLDSSTWGFNRASNLADYLTSQDLIDQMVSTVSCGGNILVNIGPGKDGTISPIFQDRLNEMGKWLKVNGEAIYKSSPWQRCQNDTVTPHVWYTTNERTSDLYVIVLRWPTTGKLHLGCPKLKTGSRVTLVGAPAAKINAITEPKQLTLVLPDKALAPTSWGSVIKITNPAV